MKQQTPPALVAAARRLFARHGYEGTSVRAITKAARANLGAITYHFGSKRKLYDQVLDAAAGPLADRVVAAASGTGTASARVAEVVGVYFAYLAENPDIARLLIQELVLERPLPAPIVSALGRIIAALTGLVSEGQTAGEFRAGDPRVMAIGIISQPVQMNLVRRALKELGGLNLDDATTRAKVVEQVVVFTCAGLKNEEQPS